PCRQGHHTRRFRGGGAAVLRRPREIPARLVQAHHRVVRPRLGAAVLARDRAAVPRPGGVGTKKRKRAAEAARFSFVKQHSARWNRLFTAIVVEAAAGLLAE